MKKITTSIAAAFIMISSYAQSPSGAEFASTSIAENPGTNNNASSYHVNIKAVRDFYERYGDKNEASWYNTNKFYRAKFKQGEIAYMTDYDLKGKWLQTIKTYGEFQLPAELRNTVKREYFDDHIFLVQEINQPNGTNYLIRIENSKDWKILNWSDDELTVVATYDK
ncbi:MAG: hypothetical protein QM726_18275 [Chitinophagaceae bacterium]